MVKIESEKKDFMNTNIEKILQENFKGFLKLVELGVIDKEIGMKTVINCKEPLYIYNFAKNIKGANIEKLTDAIIKIQNAEYIYYFARDINDANIEKLTDAIIATKSAYYIYYFARDINDANIEKLTEAIIKTQNAEWIYLFAKNIKGANIEKLTEAIIKTQNAEYIYRFSKNIKCVNIERLPAENEETRKAKKDKQTLTTLKQLLEEKKFEEILNNKEKYSQLFIDDNQSTSKEMSRTLKRNDVSE